MDADKKAAGADVYDEELRDILIAISVIAKRLATKMENAVRSDCEDLSAGAGVPRGRSGKPGGNPEGSAVIWIWKKEE